MSLLLLEQWKLNSQFFKKSYAQVETFVAPMALQKSGGLKPKRKPTCPISIRLSASQKEEVRRKAQRAGMTINAFLKYLALGFDHDPHLRKLFLMLNRELTAQGRNFNQITKSVNNGTITQTQELVAALDAIGVPLVRALHAVKKALAHNLPQP